MLLEFINIRKTELRRTACIAQVDLQHTCIKGINSVYLYHLDISTTRIMRKSKREERMGWAAQELHNFTWGGQGKNIQSSRQNKTNSGTHSQKKKKSTFEGHHSISKYNYQLTTSSQLL